MKRFTISDAKVKERRESIAKMMSMSVISPQLISKELGLAYQTVINDMEIIKAETKPWMYGLARDGYAFDCHMAINAVTRYEADMEKDLQELMDEKTTNKERLVEIDKLLKKLSRNDQEDMKQIVALYREIGEIKASNVTNFYQKLAVRTKLVEFKFGRLNIEGEGPTLLTVRNIIKGEFLNDKETLESQNLRKL